jgi:hypothetical protein
MAPFLRHVGIGRVGSLATGQATMPLFLAARERGGDACSRAVRVLPTELTLIRLNESIVSATRRMHPGF